MASLGDAIVQFPVSGNLVTALVRVASQALSSSLAQAFHPGVSTGVQVLSSNPSRQALVVHNSGTQAFLLGYGQNVTTASFSEKIAAFQTLTVKDPVYTGAIFGMWDASGTLSGSLASLTQLIS